MSSECKKERVWEIETLYGTEDIRFYIVVFAVVVAVGIFCSP